MDFAEEMGDAWLAKPPRKSCSATRAADRPIEYPELRTMIGKPLRPENVEVGPVLVPSQSQVGRR
ncbi:hypothetical protein [Bradyrhizobium australiense]|uniref:Uncharacterized protein n=1 Tax=Bradyrhizobium australiense TaxID=2721161 RepID=A0A7Y4LUZ8_9BRAD|nr:hypothetical protein [Bradyrhizobium australiense]NOJ39195.1 hypothetical protein [Bradyrhizobium australiense]